MKVFFLSRIGQGVYIELLNETGMEVIVEDCSDAYVVVRWMFKTRIVPFLSIAYVEIRGE